MDSHLMNELLRSRGGRTFKGETPASMNELLRAAFGRRLDADPDGATSEGDRSGGGGGGARQDQPSPRSSMNDVLRVATGRAPRKGWLHDQGDDT